MEIEEELLACSAHSSHQSLNSLCCCYSGFSAYLTMAVPAPALACELLDMACVLGFAEWKLGMHRRIHQVLELAFLEQHFASALVPSCVTSSTRLASCLPDPVFALWSNMDTLSIQVDAATPALLGWRERESVCVRWNERRKNWYMDPEGKKDISYPFYLLWEINIIIVVVSYGKEPLFCNGTWQIWLFAVWNGQFYVSWISHSKICLSVSQLVEWSLWGRCSVQ